MKALKIAAAAVAVVIGLLLVVVVIAAMRFNPENYKGELQALVKDKTGRTLAIDGPLKLSFFPKLAVEAERLRLSEPGSERPFAQVGELRLSLALMPLLSQKLVVDRVALSGVSAEVVKRKDGRTSIDDLTGGGGRDKQKEEKSAAAPLAMDVSGVHVSVDKLVWRDERDGGEWRITSMKLETGRIADDAPGKMKMTARVEGTQPTIRADVDLSSAYRFNLGKQTASLTDVALKIAGDLPSMKGVKLSVDGQLDADWGKGTAGGTLAAKFDESTLKARFDVKAAEAKGAPAAISFDADVDKLNLDRYQSAAAPTSGPAGSGKSEAGKGGGKPQAEQALDLEALKELNLKGQLRIGELRVAKVKLEKVQLGLRAAGGRVDMNPVSGNLYGGTLAGSASANAHSYQFALKQQLTGVDIGALLRDAADKDLLEGRGKLTLDVQTAGRTTAALKKALGGSASMALGDGALKGINLAEALRKAKAVLGSKSAEQASSKGDKTDFSELTASFAIKNGVAHNEDLAMKSPFIRLGGAGDLDIGENRMNYLAKASVVNTSAGQGGKELESLSGLTVPVRVSGPFERLSYRIEIGSLVSDSVKQKVQESVKERVQERLKGLFQR